MCVFLLTKNQGTELTVRLLWHSKCFRSNCTECLWTIEEASERKWENMATHLIMEIAFGCWQRQFNVTFSFSPLSRFFFFFFLDRYALVFMYHSIVFCWLCSLFWNKSGTYSSSETTSFLLQYWTYMWVCVRVCECLCDKLYHFEKPFVDILQ